MPSIFLVGFMASGKSEVAQVLAERLNMPCLDLDSLIEEGAAMTVAAIFASEGEAGFRKREAEMLERVCRGPESVVATGGGSVCVSDNFAKMRAAGVVVHLATELDSALERAGKQAGPVRPLLQTSRAEIEDLFRKRAPIYRRANVTVSTATRSAASVAEDIELALASERSLPTGYSDDASVVALRERSYPVVVRRDCLAELGLALRSQLPELTRVGLISDSNVFALYGDTVQRSLDTQGIEIVCAQIAPGEGSKSIAAFSDLCEEMIAGGLDRKSAIIALGGGVVGDLAGFVAASLFRGIALVQVPTTLLAMTDSAIGGKTGINSAQGKNLIGAFWQPAFVWADPSTLTTLDPRELRAAFGELLKYALLDEAIWPRACALAPQFAGSSMAVSDELCSLVRACAGLKAAVVSEDERESGLRATLNLGHTVAHAIEAAAGYGRLLHGEAVAFGLLAACRVSHRLGLCGADLEEQVRVVLDAAGLDTDVSPWLTRDVLKHLSVDKKRTASSLRFIAVSSPGDVRLHKIELSELIALLLED